MVVCVFTIREPSLALRVRDNSTGDEDGVCSREEETTDGTLLLRLGDLLGMWTSASAVCVCADDTKEE